MSKTHVKRAKLADIRVRQLEFRQTLLEHPDVSKVIETVIRTALEGNHMNQTAAQKILMNCMLPISIFEKAVDSREKINIVINNIRLKKETLEGEVIE